MPFGKFQESAKKFKEACKHGMDKTEQTIRDDSGSITVSRHSARKLLDAAKAGTDTTENYMRAEKGEAPESAKTKTDQVTEELAKQRRDEETRLAQERYYHSQASSAYTNGPAGPWDQNTSPYQQQWENYPPPSAPASDYGGHSGSQPQTWNQGTNAQNQYVQGPPNPSHADPNQSQPGYNQPPQTYGNPYQSTNQTADGAPHNWGPNPSY